MTMQGPLDASSHRNFDPLPLVTPQGDDMVRLVDQQTTWVAVAVAQADPQQWLFAQRAQLLRQGHCDPWAKQMLYRAGLLPMAA